MKIKSAAMFLGVGAALFGGVSLTAGASTAPAEPNLLRCSANPEHIAYHSVPARVQDPAGQWEYDYHVVWCGHDGTIDWVVPVVTHTEPDGSSCTWQGSRHDEMEQLSKTEWIVTNMSDYSCQKNNDAQPARETPWAIVSISPDGHSEVRAKGID